MVRPFGRTQTHGSTAVTNREGPSHLPHGFVATTLVPPHLKCCADFQGHFVHDLLRGF